MAAALTRTEVSEKCQHVRPGGPGTSDYDVMRGALHSLAQATGQSSWTGCLDCSLSPSSKNNFPLWFHPSFPTAPSKQNTPMAGLQTQRTDSQTSSPGSQTRIYTHTCVCGSERMDSHSCSVRSGQTWIVAVKQSIFPQQM